MTYLRDTKNRFKRRNLGGGDERGFTLVELLVVMTIIGVLAAVAIPAFLNQQKTARDTSVKSDVRNIAMNALSLIQAEPDADTYSLADLGKGAATLTVGMQTEKVHYTEGNNLNIKATDDKQGFVVCGWNPKGKKYADPHALVYNSISGGILETPAASEDCGAFDSGKGIGDGDLVADGGGSGAGGSGEQEVIENGGLVSTFAGDGGVGATDGQGSAAQFNQPYGGAVDSAGNVYVADTRNHRIRKITPTGLVTTFAGGAQGFADGQGSAAQFNFPYGVDVDSAGNVYVADSSNQRIRKITPTGLVSTLAGSGTWGVKNGQGAAAQFNYPYSVAVDSAGNVYVADASNQRIRKVTPGGLVSTFAGSTEGFADGQGTAAQFSFPNGVAVDSAGNVYVADRGNNRIRKVTPTGLVSTFAGSSRGASDGQGVEAQFSYPFGVAVDSAGNVYVADRNNHRIRKITPTGLVSTLAGDGMRGDSDGQGSAAQFNYPNGVAVDSAGNVYVADTDNHRIRKIE